MKHAWLYVGNGDLRIERLQCADEGRDTAPVDREFDELAGLDLDGDPSLRERAEALLDRTIGLPIGAAHPFDEPSELDDVRAARPGGRRAEYPPLAEGALADRVLGAWQGRCAGCLLGKPVEGWRSPAMEGYLRDLGRYPLSEYFRSDVREDVLRKYVPDPGRAFINNVSHMVEDDDTNYTVAALALMKSRGAAFSSADVGDFWLDNIPLLHTCTAERVAYRNLALLIPPPASAVFRNPYREWIGAQIRADFYGYAAVGRPDLAAEFAWRDARVSHVRNGIYGAMWVAAMIAAAPFEESVEGVVEAGLGRVPAGSRLSRDIREVLGWRAEGIGWEEAVARIRRRWNENEAHHWCHTNSNAQIVALGLLWSGDDFEKAVCRAVQACFDTDCNGATVGSVMGMRLGSRALPEKWIGPLNDMLETGIAGHNRARITDLARETLAVRRTIGEEAGE